MRISNQVKSEVKMQVFNRQKAIESLIDSDVDYVLNTGSGLEWLQSTLRYGFQGYDTFTDDELVMECLNRDMPDSMYFDEIEEV
jgi:hypothetical protein